MSASRGYILVEGHGEVEAVQNLTTRLSHELGFYLPWTTPRRWKNLHLWKGLATGAEFIRSKGDAGALLILRDEDDACPAEVAPGFAQQLSALQLPFPVGYVLMHPEYEVLFLPCLARMEALGFPPGLMWEGDTWESRRGIKEWLSKKLPRGRSYKPTVDQLPMTKKIDLVELRQADVPCFGSFERALRFLSRRQGEAGAVYPTPAETPG